MKWWVWVLLLVNVGLFAYFNVNAPKTEVANKEISPEKLKVLSAKDLEAMPKKVAPLPEAAPEQLAVLRKPQLAINGGTLPRLICLLLKWFW